MTVLQQHRRQQLIRQLLHVTPAGRVPATKVEAQTHDYDWFRLGTYEFPGTITVPQALEIMTNGDCAV